MSLSLYDAALIDKIKQWTNKVDLQIYGPNDIASVFQYNADVSNDKPIKLPLICIRRNGAYTIRNTNKQPLSYDGATFEATTEKSIQLNAIPISIDYQIDVYTRYFVEADEFIRNFIFNIINFPKVTVEVPYNNMKILHDSTLTIAEEVADNSDIPERLVNGQFTRLSLKATIADAYLWDVRLRDNYTIDVLFEET